MQCCQVNGELSQPLKMITRIRQGSILGPLLLLIYVTVLPNSLKKAKCDMFTDNYLT